MRQQTLKRLLIVVMVLAVAGTAAHYLWRDRGAAPAAYPAAAAQAVPVKADAARRGDIDLSLKVIGSAQPWSTGALAAEPRGAGHLPGDGRRAGAERSAGLRDLHRVDEPRAERRAR